MLEGVKKFIKSRLITDSHPLLLSMWKRRFERKLLWEQEMHSRMTYAELEAELSRRYEAMFGRKLDWDNPKTYNEKIHVSKLYMSTPLKTRLADKFAAREWIAERIGSEYLVPLLGVYDSFDDIDFDALPDKFVIKCTHDSKSVTVVRDKSKINMGMLRAKYEGFLKRDWAFLSLEMHYRDIPHKIIIEQYLGDAISDYKFTCLNGEPVFMWTDFDRFGDHRRNIYNMDWELQPFRKDIRIPNTDYECPRPPEFEDMKRIVKILCEGFDQVRVDLYLVEGHIYFGEMTFAGANGFSQFVPDEWDYRFGEMWPFDNTARAKVLAEHSRP
ncbi:MAG: hypothetical protein IJP89_01245 [Synergistaceae bacterium]|nr:hypothetical protein [Synergistaceae bacterium]